MTTFLDEGREGRRDRLRGVIALGGSVAVTGVALLLFPTLATLAFAWLSPDQVGRHGGWVTLGTIGLVLLGFPVLHAAAYRVVVGSSAPWTRSRGGWLRLGLFVLWTGVPLAWVFSRPGAANAGTASAIWGVGVLLALLFSGRRR